jgi:hypothetical protein
MRQLWESNSSLELDREPMRTAFKSFGDKPHKVERPPDEHDLRMMTETRAETWRRALEEVNKLETEHEK